jgi:hypothetical protein
MPGSHRHECICSDRWFADIHDAQVLPSLLKAEWPLGSKKTKLAKMALVATMTRRPGIGQSAQHGEIKAEETAQFHPALSIDMIANTVRMRLKRRLHTEQQHQEVTPWTRLVLRERTA